MEYSIYFCESVQEIKLVFDLMYSLMILTCEQTSFNFDELPVENILWFPTDTGLDYKEGREFSNYSKNFNQRKTGLIL